jgi:tyrosyl-tRNA synthetase
MIPAQEQLKTLTKGVVDLHVEAELLAKLREGRPLRVKAGFDPTRPDLHLGHTVLMEKMRQFQELGHDVIFVVGDFTAQIGDPSGKNTTRPPLTRAEIDEGARTYAEQAFKILDRTKTRLEFNDKWLGTMRFADVLTLAAKYTLARMLERDDFKKRFFGDRSPIGIHELLYPLAQAYDSVHLNADVELGGTDQLFNLLVGRELMRDYGQSPQVIMTTPILEGLGARVENGRLVGDKMSKSLDNYVGVSEPPLEQFGKLMSVSDDLMFRYRELLTEDPAEAIEADREAAFRGKVNPRDLKLAFARGIVARFHGDAAAQGAHDGWIAQFSRKEVPTEMPEVAIDGGAPYPLARAIAEAKLASSNSEASRLIKQGAVHVDGERVNDPKATLDPGKRYVIKAGKRAWAAITIR